jgi:hypothetical protein
MASRRTVLKFNRANLAAVRLLRDRLGRAELEHLAGIPTESIKQSVLAAAVSSQMDLRPEDVVGRSIGCGTRRAKKKQ